MRVHRRVWAVLAASALVAGGAMTASAAPGGAAAAQRVAAPTSAADLDILFIGAHPDDEAGRLATYGQWGEDYGVRTGVITVTRGEGGGNAVGTEEGPALGLLREDEERRAVGRAGITDIYNLDDVDFFYTVSAPLTEEIWSSETLAKVIRVVRQTKPEVIFTMDPAPSPGNHGNHQEAALLALMAYQWAGDPTVFPEQITDEGLSAWAPRVIYGGARGSNVTNGPGCATAYNPTRPTQNIYGVWSGKTSTTYGKTWAQVEREASREYASQGWAVRPDVSTDPNQLGCKYFTQFDARVPFVRGDFSAATADPATALYGSLLQEPGGLPLGTFLDLNAASFSVIPGGKVTATLSLTAPETGALANARASVSVPSGWTASPATIDFGTVAAGATVTKSFTVTVAGSAATNTRFVVSANVSADGAGSGYTDHELEVVPTVRGTQQLLPQVTAFQAWAAATGYPEMEGFVKPVLTMAVGGSRQVAIDVTNYGSTTQSGTVTLALPTGFAAATNPLTFANLAPGETRQVTFAVTNTDATMITSMQGGDRDYTITTVANGTSSVTTGSLELVPTTTVTGTAAPTLDGTINPSEYSATIDVSRLWEGTACTSPADCSGTGYITRNGDDLYIAVDVNDDVLGTKLATADCKRHWRTDSVEIAIDPDGTSENTSTTFKALVLPTTIEGPGCFGRDADNHQGDASTAPGMQIATRLKDDGAGNYTGYVVETKIPASLLPSTIDPAHMGLNVFVYDSDTQDKTGQTRIGWSTWGGVQGDPYRWGIVSLPGWTAPTVAVKEPVVPREALSSLESPQTIAQAARNGVAVAGKPAATLEARAVTAWVEGSSVKVVVDSAGAGTAHLYLWDSSEAVVGNAELSVVAGRQVLTVPIASGTPAQVLCGFEAAAGGTTSSAVPVSAKPTSSMALTVNPATAQEGTMIAVVATVTSAPVATGKATLTVDGVQAAEVSLVDGVATFVLPDGLPVGDHALAVAYAGDAAIPAASATGSVTVVAAVAPMTETLYRFYKPAVGTHFYTASAYEAAQVMGYSEYQYEGVAGHVAPGDGAAPTGMIALHRFYKADGTHFYTASDYEASLVKTYPQYSYEGVAAYVYPTQAPGTVAVHRFYKTSLGTHFYTASEHEAGLVKAYPDYSYEGVVYYMKPAG